MLRKPPGSGSMYYNNKSFFSLVLMPLVDADYMFVWIDVGGAWTTFSCPHEMDATEASSLLGLTSWKKMRNCRTIYRDVVAVLRSMGVATWLQRVMLDKDVARTHRELSGNSTNATGTLRERGADVT